MAAATVSAPAADVSGGYVWVSAEYLKELEALKAELPARIEKAIHEFNHAKLSALREKDTPEAAKERYKRHYELHKDEINKRRREARAAKRVVAAGEKSPDRSNASV